tara:strand:- start:78 stop:788 length:711 start_codon:yes stop_codon:yes gene_type:complete
MKDIMDKSYEYLFIKKSNYIRNISFYNEYNPDIQKKLIRKQFVDKHVSFYTKYPNLLKRLFIGDIKVLKNIVSDESNDIQIVSDIIESDITNIILLEKLKEELSNNDKSYLYENKLLGDKYKTNDELLSDLEDPNYYLTSYDLKIISLQLGIGFCLFTNRYSYKDIKFETHIIIHKKLIKSDLELPMICFYQDFSEDEINNKELKPIEINEKIIHNLNDLMKNSQFKKIFNKTYKI